MITKVYILPSGGISRKHFKSMRWGGRDLKQIREKQQESYASLWKYSGIG